VETFAGWCNSDIFGSFRGTAREFLCLPFSAVSLSSFWLPLRFALIHGFRRG
jgi:hypothetical protein